MNKNQVEGGTKETVGKVQETLGRAVGSKEQEAKGLGKQITGGVQKTVGDVQEALKDADKPVR